jgi:hypothetical protein
MAKINRKVSETPENVNKNEGLLIKTPLLPGFSFNSLSSAAYQRVIQF